MSDKDLALPEGWTSSPVGDCMEIHYGKGLPQKSRRDGQVPVYGSNGIVGHHDEAYTDKPTIVIGRKGSVGKIHLSEVACWPIDTTYYIDNFGCFSPQFAKYTLLELDLESLESSSAIPGINRDRVYELVCGIPPLAEQKRIVVKVETLLASVDKVRTRLDSIPDLLKRLRQSILAAAVSGKLTEDWREENQQTTNKEDARTVLDWKHVLVGEVIDELRYGTSKKCTPEEHGIAVLRIPNVVSGSVALENLKYTDLTDQELGKLQLQIGDILLIRSNGSVPLVGRSALVQESSEGMAYAGYLMRLRPNTSVVLPEYLNSVLGSEGCRSQIEKMARSSSGVNNINSEEVKSISFLLPPLKEQHKIIGHLKQLDSLANILEARYQKARQAVNKLTQSILAKALRGELVPTEAELARQEGRSYETAEELLARIKAEQASQPKPKRTKRKARKTMKKKEAKTKKGIPVQQRILDALTKAKDARLTPEQLFKKSGFDESTVDDFYEGLRASIEANEITESRPGPKEVYLEAETP